jgi:cytochrome c biogenesis protein CcmG, thiol:disulfide interchange protein DsbE
MRFSGLVEACILTGAAIFHTIMLMHPLTRYWTLFSIAILVVSAAWIAFSAPAPGAITNGQIPAPRQGFLAPDFTLPDAQGNPVQLSALRGKPVLLNFWASWCPPCKEEMPAIQRVHSDYPNLVILAVNTTYQDNEADALAFLQQGGLTFPVVFDRRGESTRLYETRALPTTFFIDRDGIIQEVVVGGPMSEALLRAQADRLLQGVP